MPAVSKKQLASDILKTLYGAFPDSSCTLDNDTPERMVIRGILSAQCTDVRVNLTCKELFAIYPDMKDIVSAGEEKIGEMIRPCGLHKMKSKSVVAFAESYCNKWGREVPCDVEELMKIPGIGKKIANLIVGEVYGKPALVVDTHCKRVMKRMGITKNDDPLKVEEDCCKVFPEDSWIRLGHMAVDLGRNYCTARSPKCDICPMTDVCRRKI